MSTYRALYGKVLEKMILIGIDSKTQSEVL